MQINHNYMMTPEDTVGLCPPEWVMVEQDWSGSGTDAIQGWSGLLSHTTPIFFCNLLFPSVFYLAHGKQNIT